MAVAVGWARHPGFLHAPAVQRAVIALLCPGQPEVRRGEPCEVADIGRRDDHGHRAAAFQDRRLCGEDHVAIQGRIECSGHARLPRLRPERRRVEHRIGRQRQVLQCALEHIETGHAPMKIGAQLYLKNFYSSFGFEQSSDVYDEDGIDHIEMIRQ